MLHTYASTPYGNMNETRHRRTFGSCINILNAQRGLHLHITTQHSTL
jgi:hypothetical protein